MSLTYFGGKRARARRAHDKAMLTRGCVQALEPRMLLSTSIQPAVPIVVNTTSDEIDGGDTTTSLREAVTQANGAGGGAITFDPTVFGGSGGTITLSLGNISIGNGVNINGPASRLVTISGGIGEALQVVSGAVVGMSDFVISGSGTALQIDSTGQASVQDVTLSGGTLDNGSLAITETITDTATGSISGGGSLSKSGAGTLTLTGTNNYSGGTVVSGGVLAGSTNGLSGNITTTSPGTLTFDQSTLSGSTGTFNGAVSGTGAVRVLGPSSTVQLGATATLANSGTTLLDAGTALVASATNDLSSTSAFNVNGTLNFGGFAQTIGSLSGAATGLVYNVSTQAILTATLTAGGDNTSTTFAGVLENVPTGSPNGGILAIQKNGSGALTLSGVNIFSGGLTLSAGQLNLNNASAIGTGTFTINAGTTIDNTTAAPVALSTNNAENWNGDFTFAGTNSLNLGTGAVALGANRIVTVNANTLSVGGGISGGFSLTKTGAGTLTLTGSNNYGGGTVVNAGVLTGSTNALKGNITTTSPGTLTFDQSTMAGNTGTFNGAITGTGIVRLLGPSSAVTMGATSTFANSGLTTLDAGTTLVASATNDTSANSAFTVNGTFNLGGFAQTIGSLSGAATGLVYNVSTQANLTATLTAGGDNTSTAFAGVLENVPTGSPNGGKLAIVKTGAGALTLSGVNIFSAGLNLSVGQLNLNSTSAIGTGTFTINAGTTLDNTTANAITLTTNNAQVWSGDFTFAGTRNLNLGTGAVPLPASRIVTVNGSTLTVGGIISGAFSLTKAGAGSLTLSGANNYSAGTNLSAGQLNINNASGIGSGALTISAATTLDNTTAGAITLSTNNAQNWNGDFTFVGTSSLNLGTGAVPLPASRIVTVNANNLTVGGLISGGFSLTKAGAGTLTLTGANNYSAGTNLNAGQLNINNATAIGSGAFTISNGTTFDNTSGAPITLSNNNAQNWNGDFTFGGSNNLNIGTANVALPASRIVTVNAAGTLFVGGIISGGFGLTKAGTGTLSLSGPNTYSTGTLISGGVLAGNTTSLQGTIFDNSVLTFDQTIGSVTSGTFTGSVSGSGGVNFLNGTVTLATATLLRNFGNTVVTGKLVAPASGGTNALSNLSSYTVNGTLDLGASNQTIASLSGSGTVYHFQPGGQPVLATLTLGGDDSSTIFTGILQDTAPASGNGGTLAVNKTGTGTFTVTGANTFTGGLTVSGGTLGVGPTSGSTDPLGAAFVTLNGGNLALNGRTGTPVQQLIPATGYNQDVIVEAGAANALASTTTTVDGTYVWYEKGYPGSGATGLPTNGTVFASAFNPSVNFQLQPYSANNIAQMTGGTGSVTLTLNTPTAFSNLNFLAAAANGAATMSATLNFSDSSTAFTQISVSDWINGAQAAFTAGGRIARNATTITLVTGNPRLYEYDYAVPATFQTKLLTSITFNETSGSQLGIYALSGAASAVQATQSYPNAVQVLNNASVDVEGSLTASLGNLTMGASILSLTGPSGANLTFGTVMMNVSSQFNAAASTTMLLGAITGGPSIALTKLGAGTVTLTGTDTYGGTTTVSAGTLVATTGTSLPGGALSIGPTGTARLQQNAFTANVNSLNVSAGGKLDIGNNKLFINYGSTTDPITTIRGYLANGFNNGAWTGIASGGNILSTRAAANVLQTTAIGYADSADGLIAGQPVNSIELKYTLYGDTGLAATVGPNDFTRLQQHYNQTTGGTWDTGDFNYDGSVNFNDFTLLTRNYNTSLGSQAAPAVSAASPAQPAKTPAPAAPPASATSHSPPKHHRRHKR